METQTSELDVIRDLKKQLNAPEQNTAKHLSQNSQFNQRPHNYRNKVGKEMKIMCVGNLHETMTENDLGEHFG